MRIWDKNAVSTLRLEDALSGSTLEIHYRLPTTEERQGCLNEQLRKEGGEVINDFVASRIKYGLLIVTGFRPGDFGRMVNGEAVPMASDPGHEHWPPGFRPGRTWGVGRPRLQEPLEIPGRVVVREVDVAVAEQALRDHQVMRLIAAEGGPVEEHHDRTGVEDDDGRDEEDDKPAAPGPTIETPGLCQPAWGCVPAEVDPPVDFKIDDCGKGGDEKERQAPLEVVPGQVVDEREGGEGEEKEGEIGAEIELERVVVTVSRGFTRRLRRRVELSREAERRASP